MNLQDMTKAQRMERIGELRREYDAMRAQGLTLDMSRGKPESEQLDLTAGMLQCLCAGDTTTVGGFDARNYGLVAGIPEAKKLFGDILEMPPELVVVGGNSSLNMMFDYIANAYARGVCGHTPWREQGAVKFLCPSPGYDRHFSVTEYFGIEMIPIAMTPEGPDMDAIERLVCDPLVKGMWAVPMYSNPTGVVFSDAVVERLAAMCPAAPDFRIMWDNAYCLHHLTDTPPVLRNLYLAAAAHGHEDNVLTYTSTSKISFPGAGVAALAASPANVADIKKRLAAQTIGPDKLNMLRHVRFFKDVDNIRAHMKKHQAILRPKFEVVLATLNRRLGGKGIAAWVEPRGGYFISVDLPDGCAKKTVSLLKDAGVVTTGAGATFPYGKDPRDRNLRIAPTYPPIEELAPAIELFCICAEMAALEKE